MRKKFIHALPDFLIPEALSTSLFRQKGAVLLESALSNPNSRYTIMAFNPKHIMENQGSPDTALWDTLDSVWQEPLEEELAHLPFSAGWVGFLSYEMLTDTSPDITPRYWFGYYDECYIYDHHLKKAFYLSPNPTIPKALASKPQHVQSNDAKIATSPKVSSNFTHADYLKAVQKIKAYLEAGDCYQVNLAQRFQADYAGQAYELYRKLCLKSPAPYAAFLNLGDVQILSSSPECFLSVEGRNLLTKPIKGTRPRGKDAQQDQQLKQELKSSSKDKAELLMITDLERNDLGKVCEPGSIDVLELSEIESFAQVYHQVATIKGRLAANRSLSDVLKAMFPGGSITGAPKKRAMEIIQELEPHPRNVYCGAIGFVSRGQKSQWNIAIRTLMLKDGKATFYSGGGIVMDSDPQQEYEETLVKIRGILSALNDSGL